MRRSSGNGGSITETSYESDYDSERRCRGRLSLTLGSPSPCQGVREKTPMPSLLDLNNRKEKEKLTGLTKESITVLSGLKEEKPAGRRRRVALSRQSSRPSLPPARMATRVHSTKIRTQNFVLYK